MKYEIEKRFVGGSKYPIELINKLNIRKNDIERIRKERFKHYLVCSNKEKSLHCTSCERTFDSKKKYKHKESVKCPKCRKKIEVALKGYFRAHEQKYVVTFHQQNKTFIALLHCFSHEGNASTLETNTLFKDDIVQVFEFNDKVQRCYTNNWHYGWLRENDIMCRVKNYFVYMDKETLVRALKNTKIKYLEKFLIGKINAFNAGEVLKTIKLIYKHPQCEFLIKSGFDRLVNEKVFKYRNYRTINWNKNKIEELMGIKDKNLIKILAELNAGHKEIHTIKLAIRDKWNPKTIDEVIKILNSIDIEDEHIGFLYKKTSLKKIINYMEKQKNLVQELNDVCDIYEYKRLYRDYYKQASELEYNLEDPYYYMPPNLLEAHDSVTEELNTRKVKERAEKNKKALKKYKPILKRLEKLEYENTKYKIIVAKNDEELIREGRILHHCVASYFEKVSKGKTAIFFVREKNNEEKPFFTVEIDPRSKELLQLRGRYNCAPNNEIENFVNEWIELMSKRKIA